ncbi:SH3 domain-containing protein [Streptomyces sp. CWNU-52B]|uniref:SH3 domain-containing protein n=1 Tax=unclassified Streptomyces TaxID=2593676 RepID=UPI0039C0217E
MKKRMLSAFIMLSGLALAGGPLVQAGHAAAAVAPSQAVERAVVVCTVNDDRVNYRGGPGTQYPVLGQVNRGHRFHWRATEGEWRMGDLEGGRTGVWIHRAYLNC